MYNCLYGIIPPKEYLEAIEFINANSIRDKFKRLNSVLFFFLSILVLPIIISVIYNFRKNTKVLKEIESGIKSSIEQVNNTLGTARGVTFSYGMSRNVKNIKLIISYPPNQTLPLPITNSLIAADNTPILLLNDSGYQSYQYSQTFHYWTEEFNNSMKPIYIRTGWKHIGNTRFKKFQYPPQLYNYISTNELFSVLKEYEEFEGPREPRIILIIIAELLSVFLIGIIMLIIFNIVYKEQKEKYYQDYFNSLEGLMNKFNQRFSSRGIIFKVNRLKKKPYKPDVNIIYIPKEQNDMAKLITSKPNRHPIVISSLNGNFLPLYQTNQPVLFNALQQPSVIKIST
ncbi:hypothetical protein ACTA71_008135 [Dictyostelium dimigraforme]